MRPDLVHLRNQKDEAESLVDTLTSRLAHLDRLTVETRIAIIKAQAELYRLETEIDTRKLERPEPHD